MAIPPNDGIRNILPPYLGDPAEGVASPYHCSVLELCQRYNTSPERNAILKGLLNLRMQLLDLHIYGYQWIAGSFVEDVETQRKRPPGDVDVVTFVTNPSSPYELADLAAKHAKLFDHKESKLHYKTDHFQISLGSTPLALVNTSMYWYGLFTHSRINDLWKGILNIELLDKSHDAAALKSLDGGK